MWMLRWTARGTNGLLSATGVWPGDRRRIPRKRLRLRGTGGDDMDVRAALPKIISQNKVWEIVEAVHEK